MKKAILLSLTACSVTVLMSFTPGKEKLFEGKVIYEVVYDEVPEMLEPYVGLLPKESTVYVKGEQSRTEATTMGQTTVFVYDSKKSEGFILMDGMMTQKTAFTITADENKKAEAETKQPTLIQTTETKTISGYECKKVLYILPGDTDTLTAFVTDKIKGKNFQTKFLNGYPMQYQIKQNGMAMSYTVKTIEAQKVNDSFFKIPDGYTVKPYSELVKMGQMDTEEEAPSEEDDE
jgi:hypothetical protein